MAFSEISLAFIAGCQSHQRERVINRVFRNFLQIGLVKLDSLIVFLFKELEVGDLRRRKSACL